MNKNYIFLALGLAASVEAQTDVSDGIYRSGGWYAGDCTWDVDFNTYYGKIDPDCGDDCSPSGGSSNLTMDISSCYSDEYGDFTNQYYVALCYAAYTNQDYGVSTDAQF